MTSNACQNTKINCNKMKQEGQSLNIRTDWRSQKVSIEKKLSTSFAQFCEVLRGFFLEKEISQINF